MPAYITHTLFSHLAQQALLDARHPLASAAARHAGLFRVAGIAGCDIQCMPYQVCRACEAPYRHDQKESQRCLACGEEALEDFRFEVSDGRKLTRRDVERDLYANTHLVLYRSFRGYGVKPGTPAGPAEQPLPQQVVEHLAFCLMDAERIAGAAGQVSQYVAFTLGWFSHVVSDALFKGVYPHAARVRFFGSQYGMEMLPAAETLTMTDIAYDWGVHWPTWHKELERDEPDGGALRHLVMGDARDAYGPQWNEQRLAQHGRPDPAIGRVIDAVRPINRRWFRRMYVQADYSAATPVLDRRPIKTRAAHRFATKEGGEMDLGQLRRYAIGTGWYDTLIKGVSIYLRAVDEACKMAGLDKLHVDAKRVGASQEPDTRSTAKGEESGSKGCAIVGWSLWRDILLEAIGKSGTLDEQWGSRVDVRPEAAATLQGIRGRSVRLVLGATPTDYQKALAEALQRSLGLRQDANAGTLLVVGPPAFNAAATEVLCPEDAVRLKYEGGVAGVVRVKKEPGRTVVLAAGMSDFGDERLCDWIRTLAG